jgi:hypothetical protein
MASYKIWRLWWDPLYAVTVHGNAGWFPANKPRPTSYTCKARTEKEAMRWGRAYFLRTEAWGGIKMLVDDGSHLPELLIDEDVRLRKTARRILAEIKERSSNGEESSY